MALRNQLKLSTIISQLVALLTVGLLCQVIDANHQVRGNVLISPNEQQEQHYSQQAYNSYDNNLGQNNVINQRKSTRKISPFVNNEQQRQINLSPISRGSFAPRKAKQIVYTDEPVPYYHSYKHIGYGAGLGSVGDEYYQPLRRNHAFIMNDNALGALYSASNHQKTSPSIRRVQGNNSQTSTKTKQAGNPTSVTSTKKQRTGTPRRPASSGPQDGTKTSNRRRFETPVAAPENSIVNDATKPINRANRNGRKNLVCYYGTWAVYRPDAGKFPVENIDPFLCTHIIYGFTGLSYDNLIKPLDPWNDLEDNYGKGAMRRFTGLKKQNPDLKTLVAIGGWNEGSIKYSKMASEPEARARFVQSVVEFLKKYNFDGLDLDWEYPGSRGGHSYDKQNFVKLIKELHDAFKPNGFLLTAAVSAGKWFIEPAYDIPQVSKYLDLINLMAYDYHGGWETKTGLNAPLFNSPKYDLTREDSMLNVNWSVNYWLQNGAAREKLILGVGSYGRSFTLDKAQENGINAPASQKGQAGPYTREPGSLGYNELCESFQRSPNAWTIVRDPDYLAPYAYNDRQWVGYDDVQSLALKAQFAKSLGLGGMMMWSIETDDFLGRCNNGEKFPLLNTIRKVLDSTSTPAGGQTGPSTTSTTRRPTTSTTTTPIVVSVKPTTTGRPQQAASTTTTTRKPAVVVVTTPNGLEVEEDEVKPSSTTRRPTSNTSSRRPSKTTTTTTTMRPTNGNNNSIEFRCIRDGMFADPRNCRKFVRCVSAGGNGPNYALYRFDCGPGTAFNEQQQYCDHIYNVPTCNNKDSSSSGNLRSSNPFGISTNNYHHQQLIRHNQLGIWRQPY